MFVFDIARIAQKSLIYEASVYPKPGLVTPLNNGSHDDMEYRTFIDSALALLPCYISCTSIGREMHALAPTDVLPYLREAGKQGEREMYGATNGVNTHKGAVFLLGLLCAAAGRLHASEVFPDSIRIAETAAAFVKGIVDRELRSFEEGESGRGLSECTAGEIAYILHKVDGARGEAERGYPTALSALNGLKNLESSPLSFRERLVQVLIGIMADNIDSNLISRGGLDALDEVRVAARDALAAGGMETPAGRDLISDMERFLVEKNLSPGGSADILSCALFLWMAPSAARADEHRS